MCAARNKHVVWPSGLELHIIFIALFIEMTQYTDSTQKIGEHTNKFLTLHKTVIFFRHHSNIIPNIYRIRLAHCSIGFLLIHSK